MDRPVIYLSLIKIIIRVRLKLYHKVCYLVIQQNYKSLIWLGGSHWSGRHFLPKLTTSYLDSLVLSDHRRIERQYILGIHCHSIAQGTNSKSFWIFQTVYTSLIHPNANQMNKNKLVPSSVSRP